MISRFAAWSSRCFAPVQRVGIIVSVFLTVWSVKLMTIGHFGTDVPYWDQWAKEGEMVYVPWFERHEFWRPMLTPHNEHRMAPTLALNLGLLRLGGDQWDARVQCAASAALHAAIAALLAWWILLHFRRGWALAGVALVVLVTGPPLAWENVLGGFQSVFHFLTLFSLASMYGLLGNPAGSWKWLAGLVAAGLACVSMGSGMLVAVPIATIAALRLAKGENRRDASLTLLAAVVMGVACWALRPQAPWHAVLHGQSITQVALYALRALAWPVYENPWFAAIVWAPWLVLAGSRLGKSADEPRITADLLLGGGLWVLIQVAAVSYSRAGGSSLPAPRYGDICALGVIFSFLALAVLRSASHTSAETDTSGCPRTAPGGRQGTTISLFWYAFILVAVGVATRAALNGPLPSKRADAAAYERNVQAFVLSDDYSRFEAQLPALPFPFPDWLARILRQPTLRRLLPASIREPMRVLPEPGMAAPVPSALANRRTWVLTAPGEWKSRPLSSGSGWWKFETTGDVGRPGTALELVATSDGRVLATIAPSKPAGQSWRAAYIRAPIQPATLVARVSPPATTLGFSEPIEMSSLSYWTWRLTQRAGWLLVLAASGLVAFTLPRMKAHGLDSVRSPKSETLKR